MSSKDDESFIRWQSVAREYFSSVSNLVLGLSTGLLAFLVSGMHEIKYGSNELLVIATVGLILLAISIALAIWCAINRLRDFRATAQIARSRSKGQSGLSEARIETAILGKLTWRIFWWQLICFSVGAAFVSVTILIQIWS